MTQKVDRAQRQQTTAKLAGVVILAGGQSRRMGFPKAQLSLPSHERLLDYHVRHASQLGVPIIIADNERGFTVAETLLEQLTVKAIHLLHTEDYRPATIEGSTETAGALAAIAGAMQALKTAAQPNSDDELATSWLMVVSCDSLITAPELWQALSPYCDSHGIEIEIEIEANDKVSNNSVICLTDDAYPYPLLALYRLELAAKLCAYLDSGQRRVIEFIKPIAQPVLLPNEWLQLTNLNTPDDFKRACTRLWPASI
jgi:molybdopterin-guanine dinucleotide biosynthesis protein A